MEWLYFGLVLALFCSTIHSKPNFVVFLVDDLGIGDIGCFGNDTIKTPNIDKLAKVGARLTQNLAPESVCTPSRAAFLTGRYAIRSGLASDPGKLRMFLWSCSPGGLPQNETTFAKAVRDVGYETGMIGKWHLGLNKDKRDDFHHHPLRHGFNYFYGLPLSNLRECRAGETLRDHVRPHWRRDSLISLALFNTALLVMFAADLISKRTLLILLPIATLFFLSPFIIVYRLHGFICILMRNYEIVEQPYQIDNLTARFTDEAVGFVERNKEKPFLLFMSYAKVHTPMFTTEAFAGHSKHGKYGDNVEEMDWSVGTIVRALDRLGLREDTFVYFTSDQGPHLEEVLSAGEYHGGWKGIYKGGKGQSYEGGIRVPTIVSWPTHIPSGIDVTEPTCSFDVFPTILRLAGASLPTDRIIDGKDIMPLLKQKVEYSPHEFMFHYCAKYVHATRYRPRHGATTWKAFFYTPQWNPPGSEICMGGGVCYCYEIDNVNVHDPPLLYDITADPSEDHPIPSSDPRYKEVMPAIIAATKAHRNTVDEVPNQLNKNWWTYLQTQSCCNFPLCKCTEKEKPIKHYPGEL